MENTEIWPRETYEPFIGTTVADIKLRRVGADTYLHFTFENISGNYMTWQLLMPFTAAEHRLAIAKLALTKIAESRDHDSPEYAEQAAEALHDMEAFQ